LGFPEIGVTTAKPLYLIRVGSGDVQVNLHWKRKVDLDLHVIEPSGERIYFGNANSASGGELDLDSYAGCHIEGDRGRGNENVFWSDGTAPRGPYRVSAMLYDSCANMEPIPFRATVVLHRTDVQVIEGVFNPNESGLETVLSEFWF
jgi:uncharacterized protein YfaP (DUF2135 family)